MVIQNGNECFWIGIRLGHFLRGLLQGHNLGPLRRQIGFRNLEGVSVQIIEALRHVAGKLQMLCLVGPHRHIVRLIQQNIRCHQRGIGEQTRVDVIRVFGGLVFELGHAGQFPEQGITG